MQHSATDMHQKSISRTLRLCLIASSTIAIISTACRSGTRKTSEDEIPADQITTETRNSFEGTPFTLGGKLGERVFINSNQYKKFLFKVGAADKIDCKIEAGYQQRDIGEPLDGELADLPDGPILLCLVGIQDDGSADYENMKSITWTNLPGAPQAAGNFTAKFIPAEEPEQQAVSLAWELVNPQYHYIVLRSNQPISWQPQTGSSYAVGTINSSSPDSDAELEIVYTGNAPNYTDNNPAGIKDANEGASLFYAIFTVSSELIYSPVNHTGIYVNTSQKNAYSWLSNNSNHYLGNALPAHTDQNGEISGYVCRVTNFDHENKKINRAGHLIPNPNAPDHLKIKQGTCFIAYQELGKPNGLAYKIETDGKLATIEVTDNFEVFIETPYERKEDQTDRAEWYEKYDGTHNAGVSVGVPILEENVNSTVKATVCRLETDDSQFLIGTIISEDNTMPHCVVNDPKNNKVQYSANLLPNNGSNKENVRVLRITSQQ